jgi:hypothetical protein
VIGGIVVKKSACIAVALFFLSFVFRGTAAAQTPGASFKEFLSAYERFSEGLSRAWGGVEITQDDVIPMDSVAMLEGYYSPLEYLGTGGKIPDDLKESRGWTSVKYEENGGRFKITCANQDGVQDTFEGTCGAAGGALFCKAASGCPEPYSEYRLEYRKTAWGYVAQIYDPPREVAHRLSMMGGLGVVGWGDVSGFEPLTGKETLDYPKGLSAYYEVTSDSFNFQPRRGALREYKIKK